VSAATVDSLGGTQVVTPVRMFNGDALKIIGWKMEPNGAITRLSDVNAGTVRSVASASVRGRCFVMATRDSNNNHLKVRYWLFPNSAAGAFENKAELAEALLAEPDRLTCLHFPGGAQNLGETVVAGRGSTGQLRLWRYHVSE
jgi:hypothetical protein